MEQEQFAGHRIVIERSRDPGPAMQSHLLFISTSERVSLRIPAAMRHRPILTMAEFDGFPERGGIVPLQKAADKKLRWRVNLLAPGMTVRTISAKMLRVAEIVTPEEK